MDERDASLAAGPAVPGNPPGQQDDTIDKMAAFSAFYREFLPTLIAFLMLQGARLPDAADIAQDTMLKIYERWSTIEHPRAWARTVAHRALYRYAAASAREDLVDDLPENSLPSPASSEPEAWELQHEIVRILNHLPGRQREVLAWAMAGCTPGEIATELGITPESARTSLLRARREFRRLSASDGDRPI